MNKSVTLSGEEASAVYDLIDTLSGGNPEYSFSWDGKDDLSNPTTSACAKIFTATGHDIPDSVKAAQYQVTNEDNEDTLGEAFDITMALSIVMNHIQPGDTLNIEQSGQVIRQFVCSADGKISETI